MFSAAIKNDTFTMLFLYVVRRFENYVKGIHESYGRVIGKDKNIGEHSLKTSDFSNFSNYALTSVRVFPIPCNINFYFLIDVHRLTLLENRHLL